MPDLYGPFDNSSWSQTQWYRYAPTWAPSGVVGSAAAATTPSAGPLGLTFSGLNLTLALGRAWVYGAGYERTSTPWTGTVPVNSSSNPRVDALVLRRDLAAKTVLPTILQGTPAASPVAPARASDETGQWDLPLFSWTTPGNSGSPISGVSDMRVWVDTQGSNYAVASSGGGLVAAYGSSTSSATTSATAGTYTRILGGLNVTPALLPSRIYEYMISGFQDSVATTSSWSMQVRALAGATAPTATTGVVVAGGQFVGGSTPLTLMMSGTFTVGTAGTYSISPFMAGATSTTHTIGPATPTPAITVVVRDAGPSANVSGTTPLLVP